MEVLATKRLNPSRNSVRECKAPWPRPIPAKTLILLGYYVRCRMRSERFSISGQPHFSRRFICYTTRLGGVQEGDRYSRRFFSRFKFCGPWAIHPFPPYLSQSRSGGTLQQEHGQSGKRKIPARPKPERGALLVENQRISNTRCCWSSACVRSKSSPSPQSRLPCSLWLTGTRAVKARRWRSDDRRRRYGLWRQCS